jgi:hypothetical protein
MRGLHGLAHDGAELALQGIQIDLRPKPGAEGGDGALGVVLGAVEAPVSTTNPA